MRREDALLNEGAKLVILRDDDRHFFRLLVPKDGLLTFLTRPLPLDYADLLAFHERPKHRVNTQGVTVLVEGERVVVQFEERVIWGPRYRFKEAISNIAR